MWHEAWSTLSGPKTRRHFICGVHLHITTRLLGHPDLWYFCTAISSYLLAKYADSTHLCWAWPCVFICCKGNRAAARFHSISWYENRQLIPCTFAYLRPTSKSSISEVKVKYIPILTSFANSDLKPLQTASATTCDQLKCECSFHLCFLGFKVQNQDLIVIFHTNGEQT